jgi:hypothetical protein
MASTYPEVLWAQRSSESEDAKVCISCNLILYDAYLLSISEHSLPYSQPPRRNTRHAKNRSYVYKYIIRDESWKVRKRLSVVTLPFKHPKSLNSNAKGIQEKDYAFKLDFFDEIVPEVCFCALLLWNNSFYGHTRNQRDQSLLEVFGLY